MNKSIKYSFMALSTDLYLGSAHVPKNATTFRLNK